jgi:hypothetical protein
MVAAANRVFAALIGVGILLAPGSGAAQGVRAGVLGGVTFSNLSNLRNAIDFGGPVDIKSRTGVMIGPFVAFPMNETVALQVEALYATKGATPTDGTNEVEIKLAYVDLPFLLCIAPRSIRRFHFLIGPSVNFNVSAKTIDVIPTEVEEDVKDEIQNAEFGLVFGAGVTLRRLLVEGRYSAGLTDIADTPQVSAAIRNRAFTMLVGLRF